MNGSKEKMTEVLIQVIAILKRNKYYAKCDISFTVRVKTDGLPLKHHILDEINENNNLIAIVSCQTCVFLVLFLPLQPQQFL